MTFWTKVYNTTLRIFGDIKVFKFPFFILYDPGSYLIKGNETREIMNTLEAGDILIRGYKNYLDGYFIPGYFSHAALYLGNVPNENNITLLPSVKDQFYAEGEQIVVHAMAEGVFMEDLLNFCRCDYIVVLRPSKVSQEDVDNIYNRALMELGTPYDFQFDFSRYNNLSCTEFVYLCMKESMDEEGVVLRDRRAPFRKRPTLIPDDFINSSLKVVWKSSTIKEGVIEKIKG
ncbi:MAG: hypothetical protein KAH22_07875 [Thiotrichaceae bacterium]|nr:hypothetical protein [Thiotrichaceae bacterium]